jgi:hypothetical protein
VCRVDGREVFDIHQEDVGLDQVGHGVVGGIQDRGQVDRGPSFL